MTKRARSLAVVAMFVGLVTGCTASTTGDATSDTASGEPAAAPSVAPLPTSDAEVASEPAEPADPSAAADSVGWFLAALDASGWESLGADGQSMPLFWIVEHPATGREVEVTIFDAGDPSIPAIDSPREASVNGVAYVTGTMEDVPVARWSCRDGVFTLSVNGDAPVIAEELITHC
jgi:hypothetical protein